jgi:hypothetical protein
MKRKRLVLTLPVLIAATTAVADLELTTEIEYPKRLELKIPVEEDSDFQMRTSFGRGDFFSATGHVGRVTGVSTNRSISVSYGYDYRFGESHGSASGSQEQPLNSPYALRVVASIWAANPAFTVREVAPPVSPATWMTNATKLTNITATAHTNAQPTAPSGPSQRK